MPELSNFEKVSLSDLALMGLHNADKHHLPVALVVDADELIADTRAAILTGWGFAVLTAYDPESALELARLIPPELLIADVALTRMNGIDLAVAINLEVPDCKVILFSGRLDAEESLAHNSCVSNTFSFLSKPVHPGQLQALITQMRFDVAANAPPNLAFG